MFTFSGVLWVHLWLIISVCLVPILIFLCYLIDCMLYSVFLRWSCKPFSTDSLQLHPLSIFLLILPWFLKKNHRYQVYNFVPQMCIWSTKDSPETPEKNIKQPNKVQVWRALRTQNSERFCQKSKFRKKKSSILT